MNPHGCSAVSRPLWACLYGAICEIVEFATMFFFAMS
jgi:hypothetical protein